MGYLSNLSKIRLQQFARTCVLNKTWISADTATVTARPGDPQIPASSICWAQVPPLPLQLGVCFLENALTSFAGNLCLAKHLCFRHAWATDTIWKYLCAFSRWSCRFQRLVIADRLISSEMSSSCGENICKVQHETCPLEVYQLPTHFHAANYRNIS